MDTYGVLVRLTDAQRRQLASLLLDAGGPVELWVDDVDGPIVRVVGCQDVLVEAVEWAS